LNRTEATEIVLDYIEMTHEASHDPEIARAVALLRSDAYSDAPSPVYNLWDGTAVDVVIPEADRARRPYCVAVAATILDPVDTAEKLRGLFKIMPAYVKHRTLNKTLEHYTEGMRTMTRADTGESSEWVSFICDGSTVEAMARICFDYVVCYEPEAFIADLSRKCAAAFARVDAKRAAADQAGGQPS
jgi:hypothetical protein